MTKSDFLAIKRTKKIYVAQYVHHPFCSAYKYFTTQQARQQYAEETRDPANGVYVHFEGAREIDAKKLWDLYDTGAFVEDWQTVRDWFTK